MTRLMQLQTATNCEGLSPLQCDRLQGTATVATQPFSVCMALKQLVGCSHASGVPPRHPSSRDQLRSSLGKSELVNIPKWNISI